MTRTTTVVQSLEVLVPKGWTTDQKGRFLEDIAAQVLRRQSYDIEERVRFTGMEIDLLGRHKPSSDRVYVECKFMSSAVSANVIDIMIGQAHRRKIRRLALFSASALSKDAKGAVDELRTDDSLSFSFYGPEHLLGALVDVGVAPSLNVAELPPSFSHATLLVWPEFPYLWLLQEQHEGRPIRVVPYAPSTENRPSLEEIRSVLDQGQLLEGLSIADYWDGSQDVSIQEISATEPACSDLVEHVGRVVTADTILDYRPCRPEDFVGRRGLQKEIWDFLNDVSEQRSSTRLIALVGASGFGKSSLVSKLASRFRNKKWKNKFFLFPVDVRSARGPLFVAEAMLQAIKNAADAGFVEIPQDLCVSDVSNILSSDSIAALLDQLRAEGKVLVVFFDQFEEALSKDELLPVFRAFRRFALDVHAKQTNLVIGFSWRTGISFSDENPAYQLWNELRDYRITQTLGEFDAAEASSLICQFEDALGTKFIRPLRRRLIDQGQGFPWFLKKLCIHVYRQIEAGVTQTELLGGRLNVESLFDEDLEPLTEIQLSCLKHIARNSPVDSLDVYERYGNDVVNGLLDKRLIIRAGQKFAVYWDIFRDYLTEGKIPAIPITYIPNGTLSMALTACQEIGLRGSITPAELARAISYSEATISNIVTDLQNLVVAGRNSDGNVSLLENFSLGQVALTLREQFVEHVVYRGLLRHADASGQLSRGKALDVVRNLYSGTDVKPRTRDNYLSRLVPWLEFSGLLESQPGGYKLFLPARRGRGFGVQPSVAGRSSGAPLFLASAPPEDAVKLLEKLKKARCITREEIASRRLRNPANDLTALGLASYTAKGLQAREFVISAKDRAALFANSVRVSQSIQLIQKLAALHPNESRREIGVRLAGELQRQWKTSSSVRYANGLFRYLEYLDSFGRSAK